MIPKPDKCSKCGLNEAQIFWFDIWLCLVCGMRADNYTEEEIEETLGPIEVIDETN